MPAWSNDMQAFAKENQHLSRRDLAKKMSALFRPISVGAVGTYCKSRGWLTGRSGKYEKGNVPHLNARLKGPNSTSFRKGNVPKNHVPVGTERKTTKDNYIKVKIAEPNHWAFKHLLVWEGVNGARPAGYFLLFIDGDPSNCNIENLMCVPRGVLARLNRWSCFKTADSKHRETIILKELLNQRVFEKSQAGKKE